MLRYAYTIRYIYIQSDCVCNGAKNFTVQYVANKRNKCAYICYTFFNIIKKVIAIKQGQIVTMNNFK